MPGYSYDRRQASAFHYDVVYDAGGAERKVGPYDSEDKAKEVAESMLRAAPSFRWLAVIDTYRPNRPLWLLRRGKQWVKNPPRLPSDPPLVRFRPGDRVVINEDHGFDHWHGDKGTIAKSVPIGAWYVNMDNGDYRLLDSRVIDPA